jgi:hypothetical protein
MTSQEALNHPYLRPVANFTSEMILALADVSNTQINDIDKESIIKEFPNLRGANGPAQKPFSPTWGSEHPPDEDDPAAEEHQPEYNRRLNGPGRELGRPADASLRDSFDPWFGELPS